MDQSMKQLTKTAMMAAIIFVCTFTFKIPNVITGGYTHLGDCCIFIGVMVLGRKHGTAAAAVGAALSDLLGGFFVWVVPTFIIKGIMAFVMGTIVEKVLPERKGNWLIGAVVGGICQIIGYTAVKVVMLGTAAALATTPTITAQTTIGIIIAAVVISILESSKVMGRLRQM
ncbi:MAG: ECF transporter S component [Lachnospiraceae bacterium]|nr:ECF transporter S component [Lachnospiraceae bacterium]MDY5541756.1 ECF transporter S component [Lachnospiraceae bacterium]MDY5647144.1 ECF transporter S component [Lachnospiraceae bacterium]